MSSSTALIGNTGAPTLPYSKLPTYYSAQTANRVEGFASSVGSSITLPSSSTNTLTCVSASGATLWSKANPAAVITSYTNWTGFWMNDAATLLYVVVRNTATTPDTYGLATIDVAGTVVTLGTDQPDSDFTVASLDWTAAGTIIPEGTGFKIINGSDRATGEYAIIDATGQFTTQPTALFTNAVGGAGALPVYLSPDGYFLFNGFATTTTQTSRVSLHNGTNYDTATFDQDKFLGLSQGTGGFLRWRDYVTAWDSGSTRLGQVKYSVADVDAYCKQLADYMGLTK